MLVLAHASARVGSVFAIPRTATRPSHANGCTPNAASALLDLRGRSGQSIPPSQSVSEGDARHSDCSRSSTRCGAIIPIAGFLPGPFVLACVLWTLGAIRFWRRFDRTSYMRHSRMALTALWPLLFIGSPKFRNEPTISHKSSLNE